MAASEGLVDRYTETGRSLADVSIFIYYVLKVTRRVRTLS